jgi:hypothetical protein
MPHVFGIEHALYILVALIVGVVMYKTIVRLASTDAEKVKAIRIIGGVLLAAIIWNRLSIAITRDNFAGLLPGTFCGASSLFLSIGALVLKKNAPYFHCVAFVGLYGGLTTLIYPDFIGQSDSVFYQMTISGLVHHTVMVFLFVMMVRLGFLVPDPRKWIYFPTGLAFYMVYGLFLITKLGYGDAMLIHGPILEGTPLDWLVMGMIVMTLHGVVLVIWEKVSGRVDAGQHEIRSAQ